MIALEHADGGGKKRDPDQKIARDLLGPRHGLAEAVAGDHGRDDNYEQRAREDDADPAHHRDQKVREAVQKIENVHGFPTQTPGAADPRRPKRRAPALTSEVLLAVENERDGLFHAEP